MFDLFEEVRDIARQDHEEKFLVHARSQANKKNKQLYQMKAISSDEFIFLEALKKMYKDDLTIEELKERFNQQSDFEKLGREYERFKKKHEVDFGSEVTEKLELVEKEIEKMNGQLEYIYDLFEEVEIEKPVELVKKIRQLENKIKNLEKENENEPSEVEIITESDPLIEARANEFQKVVELLGTEDVFEHIDELERRANLPSDLEWEDQKFIIDGVNAFSSLVIALLEKNEYHIENILSYAKRWLEEHNEYFREKLEGLTDDY